MFKRSVCIGNFTQQKKIIETDYDYHIFCEMNIFVERVLLQKKCQC